ncbi:MAG: sporulation protein YtfJ [Oscillospiraceae bacterium]|nr:sporulation protein YtfJ [Oscillospiraceae bacterium]
MSEHVIHQFVGTSMDKIRSMMDADTMIGNPIQCGDGTTVIPVSKVSVGFASGGSDLPTRTNKQYFAGGAGGGMSVKPVGFLVVKDGNVKLMQMTMEADKGNVLLEKIPEMVDKISDMISKGKDKKTENPESDPGADPGNA